MNTARSTPNIALIKYWGNRNEELRLPAADSLSMTLDEPSVDITVAHADTLIVTSFNAHHEKRMLRESEMVRFATHVALTKQYLKSIDASDALPESLEITLHSRIPPRVGLASSAAVFSGLARAISGLVRNRIELTDEQVSVIARMGSGSAARSVFGGFSALLAGQGNAPDSSHAIRIADEHHWSLHDIVLIPDHDEKKVGSTEGHALAHTSPHFADRVREIERRRQRECIDAVLNRDFEKLRDISEEDCMSMHRVMETSSPALKYLSDETHRIVSEIRGLRQRKHIPVLYTMDAGPTVHLICTDEGLEETRAYAKEQTDCTLYMSRIGSGASLT